MSKLLLSALSILLSAASLWAWNGPADPASFVNKLRPDVLDSADQKPWTLQERMDHYKVPGVAVAVIKDGKVIMARGYGKILAGGSEEVNSDTVFSIGSVSKVVTAALTLKMVEKGMLDLDRNVDDYLTSWKVPQSEFAPEGGVTLRMLMSHTAGFNMHGFGDFLPGEDLPTAVQTLNGEKPSKDGALRFLFPAGSRYKYSGGGTTVEQLVITDVARDTFVETAARHLFKPLKMTRSTFQNPLSPKHGNIARAHGRNGEPAALPRGWEAMPEMAASGLWTSATDLGSFVAHLINSYRQEGGFLKWDLTQDMMTEVSPSWHGLGPRLNGSGNTRFFHHGGANNSYRAHIEGHLATGDGLVLLTNSSNGGQLNNEIRNAVADAMGWNIGRAVVPQPRSVSPKLLQQYTGDFAPDSDFPMARRKHLIGRFFDETLTVLVEDGELKFKRRGRDNVNALVALSSNRFLVPGIGFTYEPLVITFHRDPFGKTSSFTMSYDGAHSHYKRSGAQ